ncbi:hypothetical protein MXM41_07850 [Leclercia adecarboxylata]|uniref:hypothetical protein n=1 Tax=Leclercia adecarboxylata TaxID=83655 RepID=UPI002DB74E4B|nr:hypothetical protein [Leclercia adecarboxylata]MEB6378846.1 hypothetical protein [Leclercia adecarboxylata]
MKSALPERQYYTLEDAAQKLGCTQNDLLHFAQIKRLYLSAYIEHFDNSSGELEIDSVHLFESSVLVSDIYNISSVELINNPNVDTEKEVDGFYKYSFETLSGVFFISPLNLIDMEFDETISDVLTVFIAPRTPSESEFIYIANTVEQAIKVKRKNLCVHADDLYNFTTNPASLPDIVKNITTPPRATIHQFNMMYSLLRISGLTDDEIYKISPSELNVRLAKIGAKAGVDVPQPDKATWSKWREKFR